ncbi:MAG: hypothetical protein IPI49_33395 [Myxococcales bacterium]|nr:hypothetical protein [Myxococcales bacterium]
MGDQEDAHGQRQGQPPGLPRRRLRGGQGRRRRWHHHLQPTASPSRRRSSGGGAFIGSDTQLVAPVTVGRDAYVGAGSTITKDVPRSALAITRVKQVNIEGWADRFREAQSKRHRGDEYRRAGDQ